MLWVLIRSTSKSTHNRCFCGEIRKNINTFWLKKKVAYQELCNLMFILSPYNYFLPFLSSLRLLRRITFLGLYIFISSEPVHDKAYKMACVPSENSDQPGHVPRQM